MTVAEMQQHVIRRLLVIGGSDIQVVDGRLCEVTVRRLDEKTAAEATRNVLEEKRDANSSMGPA